MVRPAILVPWPFQNVPYQLHYVGCVHYILLVICIIIKALCQLYWDQLASYKNITKLECLLVINGVRQVRATKPKFYRNTTKPALNRWGAAHPVNTKQAKMACKLLKFGLVWLYREPSPALLKLQLVLCYYICIIYTFCFWLHFRK